MLHLTIVSKTLKCWAPGTRRIAQAFIQEKSHARDGQAKREKPLAEQSPCRKSKGLMHTFAPAISQVIGREMVSEQCPYLLSSIPFPLRSLGLAIPLWTTPISTLPRSLIQHFDVFMGHYQSIARAEQYRIAMASAKCTTAMFRNLWSRCFRCPPSDIANGRLCHGFKADHFLGWQLQSRYIIACR